MTQILVDKAIIDQALEALEWFSKGYPPPKGNYHIITALREALADQSDQKPVLCVECGQPTMHMGNKCYSCCQKATRGLEDALKAAVPVRTKDLTDDEIDAFIDRAWDKQMSMPEIIRAVIAADRAKNGIDK